MHYPYELTSILDSFLNNLCHNHCSHITICLENELVEHLISANESNLLIIRTSNNNVPCCIHDDWCHHTMSNIFDLGIVSDHLLIQDNLWLNEKLSTLTWLFILYLTNAYHFSDIYLHLYSESRMIVYLYHVHVSQQQEFKKMQFVTKTTKVIIL